MPKKRIGLFLGGDNDREEGVIETAILSDAIEKGYEVISFHTLMKTPNFTEEHFPDIVVNGETNIMFLPDYSRFDGIVILGDILRPDVADRILDNAQEFNVPTVVVDTITSSGYENVYRIEYDDPAGIRAMVKHLIEVHGCRYINFISGFEGNKESEERIEAYRQALADAGIPFDPERVGYGWFHRNAEEVVEKYLKDHDVPDAFACANDSMAMFTTKYLMDHGYRVPEDVIVTGFDHIQEAIDYEPSITSVERSIEEAGHVAIDLLEKIWGGSKPDRLSRVPAHICPSQSCGCEKVDTTKLFKINQYKNQELIERNIFIHYISEMWRLTAGVSNMKDLIRAACKHIGFFKIDKVDIYACADIFGHPIIEERKMGYTRDMVHIMYRGDDRPIEFANEYMPDIISSMDDETEPVRVEYVPLYINGMNIGYMKLYINRSLIWQPMLYTFMTTAISIVNSFHLLWEKDSLVEKLDSMYVRDELTKLYNRFGMQRYVEKIMEVAKRDGNYLMCIALDLDGLKIINDTYGHAAGDNAILQIANAMRQASERREVCCRSGGDEFLVFGIMETHDDPVMFIDRVESYLQNYNSLNQWPYKIECSCGFSMRPASEVNNLEDLVTSADEMMYRVKEQRKTLRK
ncbi:MAG: GGDEF domain-containing protein [Lachnospiraceae bacterium]|nr:GGDEF domain-containing protein [Lachnospiraceae bacterium]